MEKWNVIKYYRDILQSEEGTILKPGKVKIALIYPNTYDIAIQNIGFQSVYYYFNTIENVSCERFVLDYYEDNLSIESQKFLAEFDIIALSINYEEDILNFIKFLECQKIPAFCAGRNDSFPAVVAGGALCSINPCLLISVVDAQIVGDIEPVLNDISPALAGYRNKTDFLSRIKELDCVLINNSGKKAAALRKNSDMFSYSHIVAQRGDFSGEFLVELSGGCKYSCRFCTSSYSFKPYRVFDRDKILEKIMKSKAKSVGLISAAFGDLPDVKNFLSQIKNLGMGVSVSSLRIDTLNTNLLSLLKEMGVRSITIAEETASEDLKHLIGKYISADEIYEKVEIIAASGIENLKLYYMIGLPGETIGDVENIIIHLEKIADVFRQTQIKQFNRIGKIKVSVNIFIPKPFTPMQYFNLESKSMIRKKLNFLKKRLGSIPNVKFDLMSYNQAFLQAFLSKSGFDIQYFYKYFIENNFDVKAALSKYKSEYGLDFMMQKKDFDWHKVLDHGTDQLIKREFEKCLKLNRD